MALVLSGYLCCSSPLQCLCHDISKAVAVHLSVCEPIRTLNAAHPSARVTFFHAVATKSFSSQHKHQPRFQRQKQAASVRQLAKPGPDVV